MIDDWLDGYIAALEETEKKIAEMIPFVNTIPAMELMGFIRTRLDDAAARRCVWDGRE